MNKRQNNVFDDNEEIFEDEIDQHDSKIIGKLLSTERIAKNEIKEIFRVRVDDSDFPPACDYSSDDDNVDSQPPSTKCKFLIVIQTLLHLVGSYKNMF